MRNKMSSSLKKEGKLKHNMVHSNSEKMGHDKISTGKLLKDENNPTNISWSHIECWTK